MAKKGEAARIVKAVLDKWQRLDILVNNAGITRDRSMRKMTDDDWVAVINTNLNVPSIAPAQPCRPWSIRGLDGSSISAPSSGKWAHLAKLTTRRVKAESLPSPKPSRWKWPSSTLQLTPLHQASLPPRWWMLSPKRLQLRSRRRFPWGRFATVEEIAKAAAFLAADGDYITGQELNVNGGYHM